jgi:hypothetical protein
MLAPALIESLVMVREIALPAFVVGTVSSGANQDTTIEMM